MIFDEEFFDRLLQEAANSPRLRMNYDLRTTPDDGSQRMLNAIMPGSVVPIHRHRASSETVVLLRGVCEETFYDENTGARTLSVMLDCKKGNYGIQIPKGVFHTLVAIEPTIILECKDGAYEKLSSEDLME